MFEMFDVDYWQLFEQYVEDGLCSPSWIANLTVIQTNVETATRGYAVWKNAHSSDGKYSKWQLELYIQRCFWIVPSDSWLKY